MVWPVAVAMGAGALLGAYGASRQASESRRQADQNIQLQREFAKQGIQWKVQDAKSAGIHPLAALGAQTQSFQPTQITGSGEGAAMESMGQSMQRAPLAFFQIKHQKEMMELNKQKLQAEIGALNASSLEKMGTGSVQVVPVTQEMANQRHGPIRAGIHPSLTWEPKPGGGLMLTAGPNAIGIEEDPGKVIRLQKYINIDLPRRSNKYANMRNRRGPGWRKFKREIQSLMPDRSPGLRKTWQWSFQQHTYVRRPVGAPLFEDTTGMFRRKLRYPLQGQRR